jgi:integrase
VVKSWACAGPIDLEAKTLTIRKTRLETGEGPPKTKRGKRTLPLDEAMVTALRSLRTQQARERLAAGTAYGATCPDCDGEHLVVNELGHPYRPEWFSDEFRRMARDAGLPVIRLHDAGTPA